MRPEVRLGLEESLPASGSSADQRELVRHVRALQRELAKRTPDVGCMTPDEIHSFLWAWDQAIDLFVAASVLDDRIASERGRLARAVWSSD